MSIFGKIKKVVGAPVNAIKTAVEGGSTKDIVKAAGAGSVGGQVINDLTGNKNTVLGNVARGDFGGAVDAGKSHAGDKAKTLAEQMKDKENDQYGQNQAYAKTLAGQDQSYLDRMQGSVGKYQTDLDTLKTETEASQKDASNTYSNEIQPRLKSLMETSQLNAGSAMSLKDAQDPNNTVAAGTRALYDAQGNKTRDAYNAEAANTRNQYNDQGSNIQKLYETQAAGEGRQGLADTSVLQALGMQNMGGQLGGAPMSGGQLQALMGANQAQAGSAYSKTLQRTQALRDQGLSGNINAQGRGLDAATTQRDNGLGRQADLGSQGLNQGFVRSDIAYNQGQDAMDRYGRSVGNFESAGDRQQARDLGFRNQRNSYGGQTYGLQQQMNDATRGVAQAGTQRDMSIYNHHMGGQQADVAGQIGQLNAQQVQQGQMITGGMQAAGTVAGAYFGGPAGAQAGGAVGQQIGQQNAPAQTAVPQAGNYGNYGYASPQNQNPSMQQQNMGIQTYMNANPTGPAGYNYGGNGGQMGPPSPVGSSAGSAGAEQMNGLSLADNRPQSMTQRMRR